MGLEFSKIMKGWNHVDQNPQLQIPMTTTQPQTHNDQEPESPNTARLRRFEQRVSLHKAALQGKWEEANKILNEDPRLVNTAITEGGETALHLAAAEGHAYFVEQLLARMDNPQIKNERDKTALCFAATAGHVNIAEVMWEHDENLILSEGATPLFFAAWQGHKEMAYFLYEKSDFEIWNKEDQIAVFMRSIHSGLYDLAVDIVKINRKLAVTDDGVGETPLQALAKKPSAFRSTSRQGFWCNIASTMLDTCEKGLKELHFPVMPNFKFEAWNTSTPCDANKLLHSLWAEVIKQQDIETSTQLGDRIKDLLFTAVESENYNFTVELIRRYPDFIYKMEDSRYSIFHIAILQRSVEVFSLTYELRGVKDIMISSIDDDKNNILHLAAKLPHQNRLNSVPGAALQMQREVLWYKEVEKIVPPPYKTMKNKDDKTPHELFLEEHDKLMKEGEKQIKHIAKSCMLVTTLITTIVFTTAFTAPGGYNNDGAPILRSRKLFMILPISQAVATLASLISMLMFLSVLTSRYLENDFLKSLPLWLVVGVAALFLSIVAMMVAFCSCLFFYKPGVALMVVLLVLFASVPITFLILKCPLLFSILHCTYSSKWLFKSNNQLFS